MLFRSLDVAYAEEALRKMGPEATGPNMPETMVEGLVRNVLDRHGLADMHVQVQVDDVIFDKTDSHDSVGFTARGMTENLPDGDPWKDVDIPILAVRTDHANPMIVLHEMAHVLEGSWRTPGIDDGHSDEWLSTYHQLLGEYDLDTAQRAIEIAMQKVAA